MDFVPRITREQLVVAGFAVATAAATALLVYASCFAPTCSVTPDVRNVRVGHVLMAGCATAPRTAPIGAADHAATAARP